MSPSCTRVAAMTPSARIELAVDDAASPRRRRSRRLQQVPLIGPDRPVKPDRRVGRATAMRAGIHRMPVHLQRRVDHVDVGDICRDQRVHQCIVGKRNRCPPPQSAHEPSPDPVVDDPDVESHPAASTARGRPARLGSASGSHGNDERRPCSGRVDRWRTTPLPSSAAPVLVGVDAPRGGGAAVEHPSHGVVDGFTGLAAAKELQVHVGRKPVGIDGAARSGQALRDELPSVGTFSVGPAGRADPGVRGTGLQLEQLEQPLTPRCPTGEPADVVRLSPSHSLSTAAVSSPTAGAATAGG